MYNPNPNANQNWTHMPCYYLEVKIDWLNRLPNFILFPLKRRDERSYLFKAVYFLVGYFAPISSGFAPLECPLQVLLLWRTFSRRACATIAP